MFKKFNTKTLLIILVILGGIAAYSKYSSKKNENTFRDEFVKIDTSTVTQILIYLKADKGKEIKITKVAAGWELQNDKIKTVADSNAIRSLLGNFVDVKSVSLAAADKSGWGEMQVTDTSGTRIKIITKDQTYDMIIGKFGYDPSSRNGTTYIRHTNEEPVYSIEGFLSMSINQGFNSWRNRGFIHGNKDNWNNLTFTYPGDSSFVITKQNNAWMVNGDTADSTKIVNYLNGLANMQSSGFVESYTPASTPVFTLSIQGNNQSAISVQAYAADSTQKLILHSSQNADAYFSEAQSNIAGRIFVGKGSLLKGEEIVEKK
ncbi:MAG: DUF4340 domain-containing protein [Bacteroidota bacterium]